MKHVDVWDACNEVHDHIWNECRAVDTVYRMSARVEGVTKYLREMIEAKYSTKKESNEQKAATG